MSLIKVKSLCRSADPNLWPRHLLYRWGKANAEGVCSPLRVPVHGAVAACIGETTCIICTAENHIAKPHTVIPQSVRAPYNVTMHLSPQHHPPSEVGYTSDIGGNPSAAIVSSSRGIRPRKRILSGTCSASSPHYGGIVMAAGGASLLPW